MHSRRLAIHCLVSAVCFLHAGCSNKPNAANIELRKQIQTLEEQQADLQRRHLADQATIASLKSSQEVIPTLGEDRLSRLFTTHGLKFNRLTAADDSELRVYITPTDDDGEPLKAAGSFKIEAFDLSLPDNQRIGSWSFDVQQSRQAWNGSALLYVYALKCPWPSPPVNDDLTIKVTFTDELTGRSFTEQRALKVERGAS